MSDFLLSFPMYHVGMFTDDSFEPMVVRSVDGTISSIPFFTEELHAERFRDGTWPAAQIDVINTRDELVAYASECRKHFGASYVAVDPFPETGKPAFTIIISDL